MHSSQFIVIANIQLFPSHCCRVCQLNDFISSTSERSNAIQLWFLSNLECHKSFVMKEAALPKLDEPSQCRSMRKESSWMGEMSTRQETFIVVCILFVLRWSIFFSFLFCSFPSLLRSVVVERPAAAMNLSHTQILTYTHTSTIRYHIDWQYIYFSSVFTLFMMSSSFFSYSDTRTFIIVGMRLYAILVSLECVAKVVRERAEEGGGRRGRSSSVIQRETRVYRRNCRFAELEERWNFFLLSFCFGLFIYKFITLFCWLLRLVISLILFYSLFNVEIWKKLNNPVVMSWLQYATMSRTATAWTAFTFLTLILRIRFR